MGKILFSLAFGILVSLPVFTIAGILWIAMKIMENRNREKPRKLKIGDLMYCVAVGTENTSMRLSGKAVNFISTLDGMIAAHSYYPQGMLLYFDSYNNAKIGINKMEGVGIQCEKNIDEFLLREDGALEFMKGMK